MKQVLQEKQLVCGEGNERRLASLPAIGIARRTTTHYFTPEYLLTVSHLPAKRLEVPLRNSRSYMVRRTRTTCGHKTSLCNDTWYRSRRHTSTMILILDISLNNQIFHKCKTHYNDRVFDSTRKQQTLPNRKNSNTQSSIYSVFDFSQRISSSC
jgi:hypothetical protein